MLECVQLGGHGICPLRIAEAEYIHCNSAAEIDVFLARCIVDQRSLAVHDLYGKARICVRDVFLVLFKGIHADGRSLSLFIGFVSPCCRFYASNIVPMPSSVRISINIEWGILPSMIKTFFTPSRMASVQQSTFGIIPPSIMFEIVRGEGGVLPLDADFVRAMAQAAAERDILLIADEVQCGNGRCGKLYAYMNYGILPDIVTTAKGLGGGLPIGVAMLGEKVQDVFAPGLHGSTFGGNPVCCAGAISVLSRLDDALFESVMKKSEFIKKELSGVAGITGVTGMGLMLGISTERPAAEIAAECMAQGVLVLTAKNKLRLLPALNIPMNLLEGALQIIKSICANGSAA